MLIAVLARGKKIAPVVRKASSNPDGLLALLLDLWGESAQCRIQYDSGLLHNTHIWNSEIASAACLTSEWA